MENENKRKRGAPKGNQNAKGSGAPKGNQNAVTHGAFCKSFLKNLTTEELNELDCFVDNPEEGIKLELKLMYAKQKDLLTRLAKIKSEKKLEQTKVIENIKVETDEDTGKVTETVSHKTIISSPAFEKEIKLQDELNKVENRIIKLLDNIKSYQTEQEKIKIDKERLDLQRLRVTGEIEVDVDEEDAVEDEDL